EDAGRIDEDDLRPASHCYAAHDSPGGLHLMADDRDLRPDQLVDERRLAGVGRANQRDEAGAGHFSLAHEAGSAFHTPSRTSSPVAALCSASRLERPVASTGARPST